MFAVLDVSTISFLSGCTVLAMTCYSVGKAKWEGSLLVDMKTGTPLAIGAAIGGIAGKRMFQAISSMFSDQNRVGAVQAVCLLLVTFATLIYTVNKRKIATYHMESMSVCMVIGVVLGIFSSFLGIGGGPINLVVFYHFFSMDTKTAAQNSLYVILFSQMASLINTIVTGKVPQFSFLILVMMVIAGILGGVCGRNINKKIDDQIVDHLFVGMMLLIICINIYNVYQFL